MDIWGLFLLLLGRTRGGVFVILRGLYIYMLYMCLILCLYFYLFIFLYIWGLFLLLTGSDTGGSVRHPARFIYIFVGDVFVVFGV